MKTQISRDTHRPAKRYSGVYQQQGRMITDSDWNELVEILRRRLDEALRDVVDSGAPRERAVELVAATADDDGHRFRIQPGWVYADGVAAQVVADPDENIVGNFRFSQQADFPQASAPAGTAGVLYADVWERPVVSLEDPEDDPHLRDPALHGADTTTRTQTMAQIKWAPANGPPGTFYPENVEENPSKGNALLDVTLRAQTEEEDECDPCADEVAIATRTGNYLFRLEVHDVQGDPKNPTQITLKWSSENGAEQHRVGSETPEFKTGAWVYELYDGTTEKHLGVHLATGFTPTRGELAEKAAGEDYPTIDPEVWPWVRRWDGYCVLSWDGSAWSLGEGRDRTSSLSTTGQPTAQGHVSFADGGVTLNLQTLTLSLSLTDHTFVAGDFWLAVVREVIHDTGDTVLSEAPPLGVVHHYLRLREVDATGALVPRTTEEQRRLSFPPLTDIRAGDVGYETGCDPKAATPLFDTSHDTVQKALDQICQMAARHIGYTTECVPPEGVEALFGAEQDTVKKALDRLCQLAAVNIAYNTGCTPSEGVEALFGEGQRTVGEALDRICEMTAANIAYNTGCTPPEGVEALFGEGQRTVGEALDRLCELAAEHVAYGGSCESGLFTGEQATVREALDRLCQIAAEHVGYTPHEECEDLATASTVKEALDALCLRPTGGSVSRDIFQPRHGFLPGDAIYFDADANGYLKALADRPISTGLFLVSEVDSDEEFTLLQAGYLDLREAYGPDNVPEERRLQPGHYYFVSADAPGALTPDEPVFGVSNPILYAVSETGGYVLPWRPSEPVSSGQSAKEYIDQLFVGTVNAFAMETPPEGWLECNGQAIDRQEFARLFERIGTSFGQGNGEATFNVPDLRGLFIRGWAHGSSRDPDRADRRALLPGGASGDRVGSHQPDALQGHSHADSGHTHVDAGHAHPYYHGNFSSPGGPGAEVSIHPSYGGFSEDFPGHANIGAGFARLSDPTPTSFGAPRVSQETRPTNIALMFCIKT